MNTLLTRLATLATSVTTGITFIEGAQQERFVSYADLYAEALLTLGQLQQRGIGRGARVLFQIEQNHPFLRLFWACLLGGIVPIPLSIGQQTDQKRKLFRLWHSLPNTHLIGDATNQSRIEQAAQQVGFVVPTGSLSLLAEDLMTGTEPGQLHPCRPTDLAFVQYSSGSTGMPKGVMLTHANLLSNTEAIRERSEIGPGDTALNWMPLTHDMGLIGFHLTALLAGINQCVMPTALFVRRPALWLEKASEHRATHLYSPNFGYQYFLSSLDGLPPAHWDLSSVRLIYNGAEQISVDLCNQFVNTLKISKLDSNVIFPSYGLAEASVAVTLPTAGEGLVEYHLDRRHLAVGNTICPATDDSQRLSFVTVGRAIRDCAVQVCDKHHRPLPERVVGYVQVRGRNVTKGYLGNATATRELFTTEGWLQTHDLGFLDGENLVVVGRAKNLIIINGQNYYPHDIERAAMRVPGIELGKVVACSSRRDQTTEQALVFVLWKKSLADFAPVAQAIRDMILKRVGLPLDQVLPIRQIPKTTSGKIQHFQLVTQFDAGEFDEAMATLTALRQPAQGQPNQTGNTLNTLRGIWSELTGSPADVLTETVGAAGLNSLLAIRLQGFVKQEFGVLLPLQRIADNPTLLELSQFIDSQQAGATFNRPLLPTLPQPNFPILPMQERFRLIEQYSNGQEGLCHIALGANFTGIINETALANAWTQLVERHESLRTILTTDDVPRLVVLQAANVSATLTQLDNRANGNDPAQIQALLTRESQRPFDLGQPPLARATLIRTADTRWTLLLTLHHLISDGWSLRILCRELGQLYEANRAGLPNPLLPLSLQFRDYLVWRGQQETEMATASGSYWKGVLANPPTPLELVPGRQRSAVQTFGGKIARFTVPSTILTTIKQVGERHQASVFQVLLTAINALLYTYTGQTDMVLGTDVSGRNQPDLDGQIGLYINTLPLRIRFDPAASTGHLLAQVKAATLGAFDHQGYGFDRLVDELGLTRDMSRTPLFDLLVLYQPFNPTTFFETFGADLNPQLVEIDLGTSLLDMQWEFVEENDSLALKLHYNTTLFAADYIDRLGHHFVQVLARLADHMDRPLLALNGLVLSEQEQLNAWSIGPKPDSRIPGTLTQLIEQQALKTPSAFAVVCEGRTLTYEQLNGQANLLAHYLRASVGLLPNERVLLDLARNEYLLVGLLAVLKAGGAFLTTDDALPPAQVQTRLVHANVKAILTDKPTDTEVRFGPPSDGCRIVVPAALTHELAQYPLDNPRSVNFPGDLAYILYTSGTTGLPKGVMIEHRAVADYAQTFAEYFGLLPTDRVIQQASLLFDTAIEEIFPALSVGACVAMVPGGGSDSAGLLQAIKQEKATVLSTTPLVINELNNQVDQLATLRLLVSGGDELHPAYLTNLLGKLPIYNTYGPTETTVCATYHEVKTEADLAIIGQPIINREVVILTPGGLNCCPIGVAGEICIGGMGLARGYLNDPRTTAEKFIQHPHRPNHRLYRTGDRGRWTPGGTIEFLGRTDQQVKVRGYRIEIAGIEAAMLTHPAVSQAVVQTWETPQGDKQLVAYWTGPSACSPETLRHYLSERLPAYMVPACLMPLSALPLTPTGKIDRKALPIPSVNQMRHVAPASDIEVSVCQLWEEVLETSPIGIHDNFFERGGHSLKAARLLTRIGRELGVSLTLRDLFAHPTVADLIPLFRQNRPSTYALIEPVADQPYYDLSPAQRRIWLISQLGQPASVAYNMVQAFVLTGQLNQQALQNALNKLVERHESLRTTFAFIKGEPRQLIRDAFVPHLHQLDGRNNNNPSDAAEQAIQQVLATSFDLENGPLFNTTLVRQGEGQWLLLFSVHHSIADGWSSAILMEELLTLYAANHTGKTASLPPVGLRYRDYATWVNQLANQPETQSQAEFWLTRFRQNRPILHFPTDHKPTAQPTFRGQTLSFALDQEQTRRLKTYAQNNQLTINGLLFGLYAVLLQKRSGQNRFVVGTLAAGRNHPDLEQTVGMFANFLPVLCDINLNHSLADHLQAIQQELTAVYDHQAYPLENLMETLQQASPGATRPLYSTMLIFHNETVVTDQQLNKPLTDTGLHLVQYPVERDSAKLDFKFDLTEQPETGQLHGAFEYNTALLEPQTARQLVAHYVDLLTGFADNLQATIGQLTLSPNTPPTPSPVCVQISATFTADPLLDAIDIWGNTFGLRIIPTVSPYNQVIQQLLLDSPLAPPDIHLLLVRFEDWLRDVSPTDEEQALNVLELNRELLTTTLRNLPPQSPVWIGLFAPTPMPHISARVQEQLQQLHLDWRDQVAAWPFPTIDFTNLAVAYRLPTLYDQEQDRLGHMPFTDACYAALGTTVARRIRAWKQEPFKVIAVDADNTLWRGVCGEGHPLDVQIDEPSLAFQSFLLQKHAEGFLLVLASKNNEADVWTVFDQHPHMLLRREHFAAWRINWQPKSDSVRAMAATLKLGLNSFVFIDDSPVECFEMVTHCAEVLTLPLPAQPDQIPHFLQHLWALDKAEITAEDQQRNALYRAEQNRQTLLNEQPVSLDSFIRNLTIQVTLSPASPAEYKRVAQLTYRTNQFNTSLIRRNETEIATFAGVIGNQVWVVQVTDRFGDYGLSGVVLTTTQADTLIVDTFLLSCRVLGRGVDVAVMSGLKNWSGQVGLSRWQLDFRPSPKNQTVTDSLRQAGWQQTGQIGPLLRHTVAVASVADSLVSCTLRESPLALVGDAHTPTTGTTTEPIRCQFDHVGIAVERLHPAMHYWIGRGYTCGPVTHDPLQEVYLVLCTHPTLLCVELICPQDENAGLNTLLKRAGEVAYHVCYRLPQFSDMLDGLASRQIAYTIISNPKPAPLFGDLPVMFIEVEGVGIVELLQDPAPQPRSQTPPEGQLLLTVADTKRAAAFFRRIGYRLTLLDKPERTTQLTHTEHPTLHLRPALSGQSTGLFTYGLVLPDNGETSPDCNTATPGFVLTDLPTNGVDSTSNEVAFSPLPVSLDSLPTDNQAFYKVWQHTDAPGLLKLLRSQTGTNRLPARQGSLRVQPADTTETMLLRLWREVLRVEEIGVTDDFFALGGNSIWAIRLLAAMQRAFFTELNLNDIFENPSIRQQAALVRQSTTNATALIPVLPDAASYETSHAQQRLWTLHYQSEERVAYNLNARFSLSGAVDPVALRTALLNLIDRHESLRTTFHIKGGNLVQTVHEPSAYWLDLTHYDWQQTPDSSARLEALVEQETLRWFDLENGPLMRFCLIQTAAERYQLLSVGHHIMCDEWSMGVLLSDFGPLYRAACEGLTAPLPNLRLHYTDYAAWQNERLQQADSQVGRNYWLGQFADIIPQIDWGWARVPTIHSGSGGAVERVFIDAVAWQALRETGEAEGATSFMTLLTVVNALLYRYTRQTDLVLGTSVAEREHPDLANQVGLYLNQLPLRTAFSASDTFTDLLNRVKTVVLGGFAHKFYPLDLLLDSLNQQGLLQRADLFSVMVDMRKPLAETQQLVQTGLDISLIPTLPYVSRHPLSFAFTETPVGLEAHLIYDPNRIDPALVTDLVQTLHTLIHWGGQCPHKSVYGLVDELVTEQQSRLTEQKKALMARSYGKLMTLVGAKTT